MDIRKKLLEAWRKTLLQIMHDFPNAGCAHRQNFKTGAQEAFSQIYNSMDGWTFTEKLEFAKAMDEIVVEVWRN